MSNQSEYGLETETKAEHVSGRQARAARRAERRAARDTGGLSWMAGLILIAIGVFYLLNFYGVLPSLANWWALFMLLPAVGTLAAARGAFRSNGGQWTAEVTLPLIAGLLLLGLTAFFLFGLSFSWLWPLFLIAAGLLIIAVPLILHNR